MHDPSDPDMMARMAADPEVRTWSRDLFDRACDYRYSYNFTWAGRPIIQFPEDIVAYQEIVWRVKPDVIVETGIAHGGSLILSASLLEMIGGNGKVIGIDIDIREHNRVRAIRINTIGMGRRNSYLLRNLARHTGGIYRDLAK